MGTIALLALLGSPVASGREAFPWSHTFSSLEQSNQTLQDAFAQHPPMKKWFKELSEMNWQRLTISSTEELLGAYLKYAKKWVFTIDMNIIALEIEMGEVRGLNWDLIRRYEKAEQDYDYDYRYRHPVKLEWDTYVADREVVKIIEKCTRSSYDVEKGNNNLVLSSYLANQEKKIADYREARKVEIGGWPVGVKVSVPTAAYGVAAPAVAPAVAAWV